MRKMTALLMIMIIIFMTSGCALFGDGAQQAVLLQTPASGATEDPASAASPTPAGSPTAERTATPTPAATPAASPTATPAASPTMTPTASPTPTLTASPSQSPSASPAAPRPVVMATPPVLTASNGMPYYLTVDTRNQVVMAWGLDESGTYGVLARQMICSTGKGTSSPLGTWTMNGDGFRWAWFEKYKVWAQYATRIAGSIWFHSVLYDKPDESTLRMTSFYNLGSKASHGCIRLMVADAKWIYNNCTGGTMVYIYEGADNNALRESLMPSSPDSVPEAVYAPAPNPTAEPTPEPTAEPQSSENSIQDGYEGEDWALDGRMSIGLQPNWTSIG